MRVVFFVLIFFKCFTVFGQKAIIRNSQEAVLRDPITKSIYVLDASHKYITAYSADRKKLWVFSTSIDSYSDNQEYGRKFWNKQPLPVAMSAMEFIKLPDFYSQNHVKGETVILVRHTNCFTIVFLENGAGILTGCD